MADLLYSFYGDDFTGSTDSLEALALGGVRSALFLQPPRPEDLQGRFADLQAVGVAGISRSLAVGAMEVELRPKLEALHALQPPLCHYKTCSTFDSSPLVGSIGRATDIGWSVFQPRFVPVVVGAPALKRYLLFGNLFATVEGETYRLDRHPTMSKHPITPMDEGDLRQHLARQTDKSMDLIDVLVLSGPPDHLKARFAQALNSGAELIFFDTLDEGHLLKIGRLIWENRGDRTGFVVGSSGVEYALAAYWREAGLVSPPESLPQLAAADQLVVMSGSASPTTAAQIDHVRCLGYEMIRLDTVQLITEETVAGERDRAIQAALAALAQGRSVILFTAEGPDDPALKATARRREQLGLSTGVGPLIGQEQGRILRAILEKTGLRRACVAGGDTSGYVARELGIFALEVLVPIAPGGPLCWAASQTPRFDGLEISLKGGQVGQAPYFEQIQQGHA